MTHKVMRPVIATAAAMIVATCGGPPFNSYDPPPTFAIHWLPQGDAEARFVGSTLKGTFQLEIADSSLPFTVAGNTRNFLGFVAFGRYLTVDGGRWPARWLVEGMNGCGEGTATTIDIKSKMVDLYCTPRTTPIRIAPAGYQGNAPPSALTLGFDTGFVPPGTSVSVYIVDSNLATVISSATVPTDSSGSAQIAAPWLYDGHYTVLAEFPGAEPAIDGAQGGFDIWGNPQGGGPDPCASPDTHNHSGSCGGADVCGHVFGSDTDCGCVNAPIVYDTCSQYVCDTAQRWVDDWCQGTNHVCDTGQTWVDEWCTGTNHVCDTGTYCWETCDEWGNCWTDCAEYQYNCRDEPYSYVCGGHWESYEYNCRDEPYSYVCGGHWESYQTNCRTETYACNPHQCGR